MKTTEFLVQNENIEVFIQSCSELESVRFIGATKYLEMELTSKVKVEYKEPHNLFYLGERFSLNRSALTLKL